jgi:hypothetical protein
MEKCRSWAARDVVAEEGGEVNNEREANCDTKSAKTEFCQFNFIK